MKKINEETALEVLKANSFREISKEKILDFMSMLPNMEPEVAMKALEQFPHYISSAANMLGEYRETVVKAIESGDKNLTVVLQGRLNTIDELSKKLEDEDLTFEQKMAVAELMKDLHDENSKDLSKHDEFLFKALEYFLTALAGVFIISSSIFIGRGRIRL